MTWLEILLVASAWVTFVSLVLRLANIADRIARRCKAMMERHLRSQYDDDGYPAPPVKPGDTP